MDEPASPGTTQKATFPEKKELQTERVSKLLIKEYVYTTQIS